jgi:hypothetical protein
MSSKHLVRRRVAAFIIALSGFAPAWAQSEASVKLFKLVSARDEIVIGVEAAQLGTGAGPDVGRLASALADKGQLTVWQYASQKDASGALVQAPLRQVAIFKNDTVRIEPYSTPLPVKPPGAAK